MTTLQEKRHRETINSIARTVAQRDACLANLIRYEVRLKALRKLEARQLKALSKPAPKKPAPPAATAPATSAPPPEPLSPATAAVTRALLAGVNDAIPSFLDRRNLIADPKTKDRNAERRTIEKEKRDAKLTGKLKEMPLTGRAALKKISAG